MTKKRLFFMTLIVTLCVFSFSSLALAEDFEIDSSKTDNGVIIVKNIKDTGKRMKIQIVKGENKFVYEIRTSEKQESYPLQLGNGTYKISILENIADTRYKVLKTSDVEVKLSSDKVVYLQSVQSIQWTDDMAPVKYAKTVMAGKQSDLDKVKAIYNHMVENYSYNWDVYNKLPSTYLPDIETTYTTKTGICYDYSSLTASMLRSLGYPTRLVKGYSTLVEGYHAWNEVWLNNEWITIDTTVDSSAKSTTFKKDKTKYTPSSYY